MQPSIWAICCGLLAASIMIWPGPAAFRGRLRPVGLLGASASSRWKRSGSLHRAAAWIASRSRRYLVAGGAALCGTLGLTIGPLVAVASAIAGACAGGSLYRFVQQRTAAREATADIEVLQSLADELRSGQDVAAAMAIAAQTPGSRLSPGLHAAAAAIRFGSDPTRVLTEQSPNQQAVRLAGLYRLAQRHGVPLADAVDDLTALGRSRLSHQRRIRSLLAGPNASSAVLCLLPVFGLVMGESIGARPLHFLTESIAGGIVLIIGVSLACLGLAWTGAIGARVRNAS